jgi:uncharacterized protein DUF6559
VRLDPAIHEDNVDHRDKLGDGGRRMGWLEQWRLRRAAKQYACRLGPHLRRAYGAPEHYTAGQIRQSVAKLGLNARVIALGYAAFMSEGEYSDAVATAPVFIPYEQGRELFERYRPFSGFAASPNSGPNPYVMQGYNSGHGGSP